MSQVLIQFKELNPTCINKILREKLSYILYPYQGGEEIFCFEGWNFIRRIGKTSSLEREAKRLAFEIGEYGFVSNVRFSYDRESDRYRIVVFGRTTYEQNYIGGFNGNRSFGGFIDESFDLEPLESYCEKYKRDTKHLRIPKTFDVYSGYSKDGRLRTVVHWEDGEKTSVYLKEDDWVDFYLAIAYCYVKRKFGNLSHFKRIVERNTKDVTANVKRFIYGGDSTLLVPVVMYSMYSIYDQVALYLAISYLGDTDQWLTEEDMKRLEDSVNE